MLSAILASGIGLLASPQPARRLQQAAEVYRFTEPPRHRPDGATFPPEREA